MLWPGARPYLCERRVHVRRVVDLAQPGHWISEVAADPDLGHCILSSCLPTVPQGEMADAMRSASIRSSRNIPLIGLVNPVNHSPGAPGALAAP